MEENRTTTVYITARPTQSMTIRGRHVFMVDTSQEHQKVPPTQVWGPLKRSANHTPFFLHNPVTKFSAMLEGTTPAQSPEVGWGISAPRYDMIFFSTSNFKKKIFRGAAPDCCTHHIIPAPVQP